MAVFTEFMGSREATVGVSESSFQLQYHVHGTEDDLEVHATLQTVLTPVARGLLFQNYTIRHLGDGLWEANANYGANQQRGRLPTLKDDPQKPKKIGRQDSENWTFDTTGGTEHITHSLNTVSRTGPRKTFDIPIIGPRTFEIKPPDVKRAIGVTKEEVEGVDIVRPSLQFTETWYTAPESIDDSYINDLFELTGTINNDFFREFLVGEVLFLGCTGALRNQTSVELTYRFQVSYTKTFLEITPDLIVPEKRGHDYLWVAYEDDFISESVQADEGDANIQIKHYIRKPVGVYVEQVYPYGDFSLLKIGT